MNVPFVIFILTTLPDYVYNSDGNLASKVRAEKMERIRCGYNLNKLWTAALAHSPFAAPPLISYVDDDNSLDIVAAPFSESFSVLESKTGKVLANTAWPALNLDNSVYSSPIQYDINGDGLRDVMFTASSGELKFYTPNGRLLKDKTVQLPPVYVSKNWYKSEVIVQVEDIQKYAAINKPHDNSMIPIDPHILATPVLADINNDKRIEELVIPVSYFYEEDDYRVEEKLQQLGGLNFTDIDKYLVAGVVVLNLTTLKPVWNKLLDLTQVSAAFPAYNLFSPTVIDIDGDGGPLEVVIGTSAGSIFILSHDGEMKPGWPVNTNTIHGQITAADLLGDGSIKLVAIDTSANVFCYNKDGRKLWESSISGTSSPGSRLYDINDDGVLDVIIATNDGNIFGLNGADGSLLPDWPIKVGNRITSNVLITSVSSTHSVPDMVVMADDGSVHLISMDLKCKAQIPIGENSLVQILSHDLVQQYLGLELLVATSDGTLMCLATGEELAEISNTDETMKDFHLKSLTAETKSFNDFSFAKKKPGVYVMRSTRTRGEVTGDTFTLQFEIIDPSFQPGKSKYTINVYYGSNLLLSGEFPEPKTYSILVPASEEPTHGHVTLVLTNQNGQTFEDSFSIRFNKLIMEDLQWLLLAPFIAMTVILLVIHGFPAKDLLPYTYQSKSK